MRHTAYGLSVLLVALASPGSTAPALPVPLSLSSLRPGCRFEERHDPFPSLWVRCGRNCAFVVVGRESLEGQVNVRTKEQALEFVRLFTTLEVSFWGRVDMTEVLVGDETDRYGFVVTKQRFARCCRPLSVTAVGTSENASFAVERTVVQRSDYGVYLLRETVNQNGRVYRDGMQLLSRDGASLGRFIELPAP